MCAASDSMFSGAATQVLGEELEEDAVYTVSLRREYFSCSEMEGPLQRQSRARKIRALKAGSMVRLIQHLSPREEFVDVSYRTCFLSTYRTFTTADQVLQLLIDRFNKMEACASDMPQEAAEKAYVKRHIVSFVRLWRDSCPGDLSSPTAHSLLSTLTPHSSLPLAPPTSPDQGRCGVSIDSGLGEDDIDWSEDFNLCTLTPREFAEALTAEDAEIFQSVAPHHCLDYIREPGNADSALTVRTCIQHFNTVSLVVVATILREPVARKRAVSVSNWIDIAGECREVKNFSSLTAIMSGLQSSGVHRLKKTWALVPSSKMTVFRELAGLLAADSNHQTSRDLLSKEGTAKVAGTRKSKNSMSYLVQGVVPYLGMYLTDLTMIHTAHRDNTENGLINFDKRWKFFEILAQLTLYQKSAALYQLSTHRGLGRWLRTTHTLTQTESYQLSNILEPSEELSSPGAAHKLHPATARIRTKLKIIFSPKHVEDSQEQIAPSKRLSSFERLDKVSEKFERKRFLVRSNSMSPTIGRTYTHSEEDEQLLSGCVVKVAIAEDKDCNYKCILVTENDRATAVIDRALLKFSLPPGNQRYSLVQVLADNREIVIPSRANVFYALRKNQEDEVISATLLLKPETENNSKFV